MHLQLATATICEEGWGQVSRDLIPGTGFSVLNLLCCPDKVQGPLSPVLETVKKKFSSLACSTLLSLGLVLLPVSALLGRYSTTLISLTSWDHHWLPCSYYYGSLSSA